MHARVITGQTRTDKRGQAIGIYRDEIVTAARDQNGFNSATLLTNPVTGKFISTTVWETEADMLAVEASGYLDSALSKIAVTFDGDPVIEHFEVSVQA